MPVTDLRGYDQWKTASPYDDYDDEICICCGYSLTAVSVDEEYCSDKCKRDDAKGIKLSVIRPIAELFTDLFGDDWVFNLDRLNKAIYKGNNNASVQIIDNNTLQVGGSVENSEAAVTADALTWPFSKDDFWQAVTWVDQETGALWEECHCSSCGSELDGEEAYYCLACERKLLGRDNG